MLPGFIKSKFLLILLFVLLVSAASFYYLGVKGNIFKCRALGGFGAPLQTGLSGGKNFVSIRYIDLISTKACVVSVTGPVDYRFPDSSVRFKIGYFDKAGRLFVYSARMGGVTFNGEQKGVGVCVPTNELEGNCKVYSPKESLAMLREGQLISADLIYKDSAPWVAAEQNQKFRLFFDDLKKSLESGVGFPEVPTDEDFVIQIWQIRLSPKG